jgi:Phospholipase_D-nuclease N-terminal
VVRYLPFLISLMLSIYALFSCIQTRDEDVPHLPKLVWILLIVLVPFVGPITWLLMARSHARRRQARGRPSSPRGGRGPARRSTAPDDDPEFLAWLDRNRKRRDKTEPPGDQPPEEDGPDPDDGEAGDRAR